MKIISWMKRLAATVILFAVYELASLFALLGRLTRSRKRDFSGRILLIGTFDHVNWFLSHVDPIVQSGHTDIIVVTDAPVVEMDGVTYVCPPSIAAAVLSRAIAKFVWSIVAMRRYKADICMGYHIFPAGVISLITSSIFGCRSAFQVTAGPTELEGGGWGAENRLLSSLGGRSSLVEGSVNRMLRKFDLIVVRGSSAKDYVLKTGFQNQTEIITGSVDVQGQGSPLQNRNYDIVFVGRVAECKRLDRFLDVMSELANRRPDFRSIIVGDGPERERLEADTVERGLEKNVQWLGKCPNVAELLAQSKIFVLTSETEGVSIAMLEAMVAGCVPVVSDVGDLGDFVRNGENGYILNADSVSEFARCIDLLLTDTSVWEGMSLEARKSVEAQAGKQAIAERWRKTLSGALTRQTVNEAT